MKYNKGFSYFGDILIHNSVIIKKMCADDDVSHFFMFYKFDFFR